LLYAATLHLLAGAVTGSIFKVRTLLLLLGLVLAETAVFTMLHGSRSGLWALINLLAVQVGYFAGAYSRAVLEQAGVSRPGVPTRRLP